MHNEVNLKRQVALWQYWIRLADKFGKAQSICIWSWSPLNYYQLILWMWIHDTFRICFQNVYWPFCTKARSKWEIHYFTHNFSTCIAFVASVQTHIQYFISVILNHFYKFWQQYYISISGPLWFMLGVLWTCAFFVPICIWDKKKSFLRTLNMPRFLPINIYIISPTTLS